MLAVAQFRGMNNIIGLRIFRKTGKIINNNPVDRIIPPLYLICSTRCNLVCICVSSSLRHGFYVNSHLKSVGRR